MTDSMRFDELTLRNKALLVDDLAIPISSIEFYDHRIFLFSLNALFIEAYHNIETGEIERISSVPYNSLDKFLTRIRLGPYYKWENNSK
jgi:hypothetical protein